MPASTPTERSMQARMAAYAAHAKHGGAMTIAARRGQEAKWAREVDPDGVLSQQELARRIDLKRREHMMRLSLKAAKARRAKKAQSA